MDDKKKLEQKVSETLEEGIKEDIQPERAAVERLAPKYEIRQVIELDPILEETRIIRSMVEEVDDRYDDYVARARKQKSGGDGNTGTESSDNRSKPFE